MCVQKLIGIGLVVIVVFSENEVCQSLIVVDYRQRVQLVVPQNIVGLAEGCLLYTSRHHGQPAGLYAKVDTLENRVSVVRFPAYIV